MGVILAAAALWLLVSALVALVLGRGLGRADARRPGRVWLDFCDQHGLLPTVVSGNAGAAGRVVGSPAVES
jgi:hypothetical protein